MRFEIWKCEATLIGTVKGISTQGNSSNLKETSIRSWPATSDFSKIDLALTGMVEIERNQAGRIISVRKSANLQELEKSATFWSFHIH